MVDEERLYSARMGSQTPESAGMIELELEPECGPEPECEPEPEPEPADEVPYEIPAPESVEAEEATPVRGDIWGLPMSTKKDRKRKKGKAAKRPDSPLPEASSWS